MVPEPIDVSPLPSIELRVETITLVGLDRSGSNEFCNTFESELIRRLRELSSSRCAALVAAQRIPIAAVVADQVHDHVVSELHGISRRAT